MDKLGEDIGVPELPEVEVVRGGVSEHVAGRTLSEVEVLHPRAVRAHVPGPRDFAERLRGRAVKEVRRRGKYLWLELDDAPDGDATAGDVGLRHPRPVHQGEAVLAHLGMSGQFLVQPVGAPDERHLRVRFRFADEGTELRFIDQRTFGGLRVSELVSVLGMPVPDPIAHIAPDPIDPGFDRSSLIEAIRTRRTGIKRALLDQSLVSGIGNIYADEALWRCRLHWARPTATLTRPTTGRVLDAVYEVLGEALSAGGTSFDALYVNINGQSGYFDRSLAVYGQEGLPCPRCGAPVRRDVFMNRSAYSCPVCQPRPRNAHW